MVAAGVISGKEELRLKVLLVAGDQLRYDRPAKPPSEGAYALPRLRKSQPLRLGGD